MKKNMKGGGPGQGEEGEVQYLPVGEVLTSGILNGLGIKLDAQSIENYDKLLHNPVALEKMESGLENLTNAVVAPVFDNALNQLTPTLNKNIDQLKKAAVEVPLTVIPGVPTIIAASEALTSGLNTVTAVTTAATDSIQKIEDEAAKLNPINQINNQIESAQNAVVNTVAIPIGNINNTSIRDDDRLENIDNIKRQRGGARILSRIQKSVKNFMGKSKKITHKNTNTNTNTNKKRSMKGGTYNKNKKRVFSQKGGQILSRINESLKTFNRM
jgi:hypothetical protein